MTAPDPFFVIGTGRSGTTVTARCLGAHPALLFVDEPRFVSDILLPFAAGELTLEQAQHRLEVEEDGSGKEPMKFLRRMREHYGERLGSEGLAELRDHTRAACQAFFAATPLLDAEGGAAALRELIGDLVQWTTSRLGGQRWLIKQPDLCMLLEPTSALLPAARFVHVVRAPLDVLSSRVDRGFQPDFDAAFEVWFARLRRVAEFSRRMPESITQVDLRDLVEDPRAQIERLCAFLDLPFDPALGEAAARIEGSAAHAGRGERRFTELERRRVREASAELNALAGFCLVPAQDGAVR
jgi:hypothetical protein